MMVPPNHPFIDGFSIINHPAIGVPPFQETGILVIKHWGRGSGFQKGATTRRQCDWMFSSLLKRFESHGKSVS